jgi:RNA dependent RNA polymerase
MQMTLSQLERRRLRNAAEDVANLPPTAGTSINHQTTSTAQSFGSTTVSYVPTEIFTPPVASLNAPSASAATSFQEEARISSPDYFPTQDVMEIDTDEKFKTSFKALCEPTKADVLFEELCAKTPFKDHELALPHKLTFRHRYELQRVADALQTTANELLSDLARKGISSSNDYETFWAAGRIIARDRGSRLPERSSSSAWNSAIDSFFEPEGRQRSVYLAGELRFKSKGDEGIFDFQLKPLHLDTACRFHRKYGPSRFMVVSLPSLSADAPSKLKEAANSGVLTESVARWLATAHEILGRRWKAFFLEADKKKSKSNTQAPGYKVHLFAEGGDGISAEDVVEIEQFLDWHIPIGQNLKSTNLKLFQRFSLGLSKTISTRLLEASEFVRLPDPTDHEVMNDGCARMSMTFAKEIAQYMGLSEVPSVFQGRIAGAKGLWMVVPDCDFSNLGERNYCIEVSDSQLKIQPHPASKPTADKAQRTFEVLKSSVPGKPAALNTQLLTILHDRGVPRQVLGDLLLADIGTFYQELEFSMRSTVRLRSWVQSSTMYSRGEEGIRMTGSWPDEPEEQSIMLIEHGFTPDTNPMLRECLRTILSRYLSRYVERLQIRIPCSTFLFCIPDPYGVLKPDEIHLSFSEVWKDSVSGFKESFVDGRDILVARLPALLPSDIQRRKAVWKRELHHFKDVIVFPTTGDIPLAHLLSGGDYDGDTPWICWDPNIVKHFKNVGLPKMPSKKDCGLVQHSRKIKDVFSQGSTTEQLASQVSGFFAGCFAFNLHSSYLGRCTLEHEKVVYFDGNLSASNAIKLATLCGYLVDSAKQGDILTTTAWRKIRKQVSPRSREDPAYKNESCENHKRESNIIDYLKFWQAVPEKNRVLTEFNKHWPQQSSRDTTLCQPWTSMMKFGKAKPELKKILDQLRADVKQVAEYYMRQQPRDNNWGSGQFSHLIEDVCQQFRAIKPSETDHDFSHLWNYEAEKSFGHWKLLRASCLYNEFTSRKMVWYIAGEELCCIKAQADPGGYRTVLTNFYSVLKCDSKIAKKVQQRLDDVAFEEETFGWDGIDTVLMMGQDD